jgi:hypothetical protein
MGWFAEWLQWWSGYYADHSAVSGAIRYLHLTGIVVGGGTALAADRLILTAPVADRARVLAAIAEAHRAVVPSLVGIAATGALMFAADTETFLASTTFAVKIAAVGLLAINGGALTWAERQATTAGPARAWARLRATAGASTALWLGILLLGVLLTFGG